MSDFVQLSLGETMIQFSREIKKNPLVLFDKWIGVNNRYKIYVKKFCAKRTVNCDAEEIFKNMKKLLTRFTLFHRYDYCVAY